MLWFVILRLAVKLTPVDQEANSNSSFLDFLSKHRTFDGSLGWGDEKEKDDMIDIQMMVPFIHAHPTFGENLCFHRCFTMRLMLFRVL